MKKISVLFFAVIVSVFVVFSYGSFVYADTPTPIPVPTILNGTSTLPGLGCGNAYDTSANKCCPTAIIQKKLEMGGTGTALDAVRGVLNSAAEGLVQPVFEGIANSFGSSLEPCSSGIPSTPNNLKDPGCICLDASNFHSSIGTLCNNISTPTEIASCNTCTNGGGVWSSIGCVQGDTQNFIQKTLLGTAVGIAGGVVLLCIMLAAFQMQTSAGNAEKVKKAQELLTNCITGLMIIIFSVLILKIIGVDILRIPGFGQ